MCIYTIMTIDTCIWKIMCIYNYVCGLLPEYNALLPDEY